MKTIALLWLIIPWPWIALAQRGPMFVGGTTTDELTGLYFDLLNNRNTGDIFMGVGAKRHLARLDTVAKTGESLSRQSVFHFMQRDYEKGVALLEQSTELDPKQHRTAGWTYLMTLHDYPRALRHFDAYDALTPNFDDTDGIWPISYHKGLCYRALGKHAEAVRQFSIGIDSLAQKHGVEWVNYKQYVSRAIAYLALQQPDQALLDLEQAEKNATSDSPLVFYYKAKAFLQQGRPTDARRAFQDAQFFWQANRVKGITQPEDYNNLVTEQDIEEALK